MKHLRCVFAALICLCLAPFCALGEGSHTASDSPVYRSDFTLSLGLNADGFPDGANANYRAWEDYLGKLSLRGVIDTQDFLEEFSRVYFDGGLYINDRNALPFTYDGYYNYRYVRSPALGGASVHFQMKNFFEFMLKPYYFMEYPTQYLALPLYPEASQELGLEYYKPLKKALGGEKTRRISHNKLKSLALTLDKLQHKDEDESFRLYFYVTCLLTDLGYSDEVYERLGCWEDWLAWIDPDKKGMRITVENGSESWMLGEYEVFARTRANGGESWLLTLPDETGSALAAEWRLEPQNTGQDLNASIKLMDADEYEIACVALSIEGMPKADETEAAGEACFAVCGSAFESGIEQRFAFRYSRDAEQLPYAMALSFDWLHPDTGKPALTIDYSAEMEEHDKSVLVDRDVDDQEDFFHLNESVIEDYKERFASTLVLGLAPFAMEMPLPVISDTTAFLIDSGAMGLLGIE